MKRLLIACMIGLSLTGCATSALLNDGLSYHTKQKQVLLEDSVIAFAKPTTSLSYASSDSIVIVGLKNSYVLTSGSNQFLKLMNSLDTRYLSISKKLEFTSHNDGRFSGHLELHYKRLKNEISQNDRNIFLQNKGKDCTIDSDEHLQAQRICFDIPLEGVIYPAISNPSQVKRFSKPYPITIYTEKDVVVKDQPSFSSAQKVFMLPLALAFDVITLPFQLLGMY